MAVKAQFDGVCEACGGNIEAEFDDIVKDDDSGEWIHEECAEDDE